MANSNLVNLGLEEIIKTCFEVITKEALGGIIQNLEVFFQQTKLLTLGRNNYANYITRTVGIFPLFGTSLSAFVDSVYTDVGITDEIEHEKYRSPDEIEQSLFNQKAGKLSSKSKNLSPLDAIEATSNGFALLGSPGAGKTTSFRYIAIAAAKGAVIRSKKRLPIYLAIRDMASSSRGIEEACIQLFDRFEIGESEKVFNALVKGGHCIVLLDGLDETEKAHQASLINELTELQARYPKSIFCISARQHSLSHGITGFTKWQTLPLSFKSRLSFVKKWFDNVNPEKGTRLLENSSRRPEILDLGSSPLLLSIVCALYNNDLDIPTDTDELYARCTEGLLGAWDTFRNIARNSVLANFSIRKRIIIASQVAAALFEKGKIVFSVIDVDETQCLQKLSDIMRQELPPSEELLKCLESDFGILVKRAPNLYSFSHLTLQEYLVALYIVDNRREINLISSYFHRKDWSEIINTVAKILPNADEYMKAAHKLVRLEDSQDTRLLCSLWHKKPICNPDTRRVLFVELASKISHIAKRMPMTYETENSTLLVNIGDLHLDTRNKVINLQRSIRSIELGEIERDEDDTETKTSTSPSNANDTNSVNNSNNADNAKNANNAKNTNNANKLIVRTRDVDIERIPKRKQIDAKMFMPILNLPFLLDVIYESGFSFDDLNCAKNVLFSELKKTYPRKITNVKFI